MVVERVRRRVWAVLLAAVMSLPALAGAQTVPAVKPVVPPVKPAAPPAPPPPGETTPPAQQALLRITIDPSRAPMALGTEAGLSAEIKNISSVAVLLSENETVFVTMPEVRIYGGNRHAIQGCATFPTQGNVRASTRPDGGYTVLLQPGDSYRVFWDTTTNGCTGERLDGGRLWPELQSWLKDTWQRMSFAPGTYRVYLDVVARPEGQAAYRTVTEGRDVQVAASQQIALFGSFIGGLIAYLIKLYYGGGMQLEVKAENEWLKTIIGRTEWLSAGVFAAAMTVLASRLSDTFPIKVSASDFWGAVTLGFVFQWAGVRLLEKLPGMGADTPRTPPPEKNPAVD